jgi:antitoxin HigA-1
MIPSHREPTHPGEMLLEEFLRPLGLTQVEAADRMKIPLNRVNEIVRRKRGITADTAIRLARLLRTSPEFWMNLQNSWDIYQAAKTLRIALTAPASSFENDDEATWTLHLEGWASSPALPLTKKPQSVAAEEANEPEPLAA